jgi:hypothetical protein
MSAAKNTSFTAAIHSSFATSQPDVADTVDCTTAGLWRHLNGSNWLEVLAMQHIQ